MGDFYTSIVPVMENYHNPELYKKKLLKYLSEKSIIQMEKKEFRPSLYPPGPNFLSIVKKNNMSENWTPDGLEILTERRVFDNGGNGLEEVNCPNCNFNVLQLNWTDAVQDWFDGGDGFYRCADCYRVNKITDYNMHPKWGFSNIGITLWNWSMLKEKFIIKLEQILDSEVNLIYGKI